MSDNDEDMERKEHKEYASRGAMNYANSAVHQTKRRQQNYLQEDQQQQQQCNEASDYIYEEYMHRKRRQLQQMHQEEEDETMMHNNRSDRVRSSWIDVRWFRDHKSAASARSISSLQSQLLQVKRRLWPAAVQCAESRGGSASYVFAQARSHCNPYESLGDSYSGLNRHLFVNRSAIKLANMNAILDGVIFSGEADQQSDDPFLFCDLCAAPGGFSEYLLKALSEARTIGFGMSLMGRNEHGCGTEWKYQHKNTPNSQYVSSSGSDGTGDIYNWENVLALHREIAGYLVGGRVPYELMHLVVCDGGMDAQRDSECQELLSTKLVVCQVAAALTLLRKGGVLLIKLFGFQTASIRLMMQDLAERFNHQVVCLKPISSRPASAERYVVFRGYDKKTSNAGGGSGNSINKQQFDGVAWRDWILLGRDYDPNSASALELFQYLDWFDAELLQLNLQSCFSILSHLERTAHGWLSSGQEDPNNYDEDEIDLEAYRRAWGLEQYGHSRKL